MPTDSESAVELGRARRVLLDDGAQALTQAPWQSDGQPASDGVLVRYAAWRASQLDVPSEVVAAGLALLGSARTELDQIESGLLFAARADGLTFQQIGEALGLGSAQAAQQRMNRVSSRAPGGR